MSSFLYPSGGLRQQLRTGEETTKALGKCSTSGWEKRAKEKRTDLGGALRGNLIVADSRPPVDLRQTLSGSSTGPVIRFNETVLLFFLPLLVAEKIFLRSLALRKCLIITIDLYAMLRCFLLFFGG